ncbi:MAG: histidine phosphatase family protein [Candidatus Pacebacteria bacterium]|nr:histidine phosphatase family protein [Candidatus Paceibacterota bacterium]
MASKIIYFIRHGESELNARGIRQGPDGPLSLKGREQVRRAAEGLAREPKKIQVLFSSPFQRTRETAEIIAETLYLKIHFCDLLVERRNPSEIVGHSQAEQEVQSIVDRIDKSFHPDHLRFSDEENFVDLKARAKKLLRFIASRRHSRMLMVTHGIFLSMVVSYMLHGKKLTASEYANASYLYKLDNAGVVICSYKSHWFKKDEWKLLMWNGMPQSTAGLGFFQH